MYHTDFVCTYKRLLDYSSFDSSDSDKLYQIQFLQAFGCENDYDDDKITQGLNDVKCILESHEEGRKFLEAAFKNGLPPVLAIFSTIGGEERNAFLDTIIRSYYGWPTMDLIHSFVCKIKNNDKVTQSDWESIVEQHKELYS